MNDLSDFALDAEAGVEEFDSFDKLPAKPAQYFPENEPLLWLRNARRAAHVVPVIKAYAKANDRGEPLETIIRDMLSDLMHLCDLFDDSFSFDVLADRAATDFYAEKAGE